jgi:hypothetical protein
MFRILFFVVAFMAAIGNTVKLWDGNFDNAELGWIVVALLFVGHIAQAIDDKFFT